MRMSSIAKQRNRGEEHHCTDAHDIYIVGVPKGDDPHIRIKIRGDRRYTLLLSPAEVLECLLKLPTSAVAGAVAEVGENVDLPKRLPEVVKQLIAGVLAMAETEENAGKE